VIRLFISLLIITILYSCGKDAKEIQFTEINTNTTQDISSIDIYNNQLIAVGGEVFQLGVVLSGKDLNWVTQDSFTNKRLFGLDCNDDHCAAVGHDGFYYNYTENDGWTFTRLSNWDFQRAVSITNNHTVSVSGKSFGQGHIYHINPIHQIDTTLRVNAQMQDVASLDDNTFVAVGYGTVLRSNDGGYNWTHIDQEGDFYYSIDFVDDQHGIIVGLSGSILLTNDSGKNWKTIKKPSSLSSSRAQFLSVKYINATTIYIVGDEGLLWHSNDAGHTWVSYKVNTDHNLNDLSELDGKLYIVGDDGYMALREL